MFLSAHIRIYNLDNTYVHTVCCNVNILLNLFFKTQIIVDNKHQLCIMYYNLVLDSSKTFIFLGCHRFVLKFLLFSLRSLTLTSNWEILSNFLFLHLEAARRFLNLFLSNLIFSWDSILIGVIFLERPPPRPLGAGVFTESSSEKLSSSSKSSLESSISSLILNSAESMEPEALDSGLGLNSGTEDKARCPS